MDEYLWQYAVIPLDNEDHHSELDMVHQPLKGFAPTEHHPFGTWHPLGHTTRSILWRRALERIDPEADGEDPEMPECPKCHADLDLSDVGADIFSDWCPIECEVCHSDLEISWESDRYVVREAP